MPVDLENPRLVALVRPSETPATMEVHEFLARPPHWLLSAGTLTIVCFVGLLVILAAVIKYPDTITSRITLVGNQPVVEVMARQTGYLESLRVKEGQAVRKGEIIGIIRSPARADSVLALADRLGNLAPKIAEETPVVTVSFEPQDGLGKLQDSYAEFLSAYQIFRESVGDDYAEKAGGLLRQQIAGKETQIASLAKQCETNVREMELARLKYQRQQGLFEQKMVSLSVVNEEELALIQTTKAQALMERDLADARIEAAKTEKQLRDIDHERTETLRKAREQLRSTLIKLRGGIDVWEADYVLRAPADGTVAFYDFWTDQQFVTAGRQVFLVMPETAKLVGRTPVTPGGAGKIKLGQRVLIRLDDYPYREFGQVTGRVQSISQVAREGANLVLVDLPYPLATSFGKPLQFKQEMTGEAQIVTEDIRLIERILYEVRRAFVNNVD